MAPAVGFSNTRDAVEDNVMILVAGTQLHRHGSFMVGGPKLAAVARASDSPQDGASRGFRATGFFVQHGLRVLCNRQAADYMLHTTINPSHAISI